MNPLSSHDNSSSNDPEQHFQQQQLIVETVPEEVEGAEPSSIGDDDDARAIPPTQTSNERSGDGGTVHSTTGILAHNEVEPENGQGIEQIEDGGIEKGGADVNRMQKDSGKSEEGLWREMEETAVSVNSRLSSLSSSTPAPNLAASVGEDATTATMDFGSLLEAKAAIAAANAAAAAAATASIQPLPGQGTIATNHIVAALPMEATLVEAKTAIAAAARTNSSTKTSDKQELPEGDDAPTGAASEDATTRTRRQRAIQPGATSIVPLSDSGSTNQLLPAQQFHDNNDEDHENHVFGDAALDTTAPPHYAVSAYTVDTGRTTTTATSGSGSSSAAVTGSGAPAVGGPESVDSERTRFRQQVRDSLAAQAVQAVEAQPIQSQGQGSEDLVDRTNQKRQRRKVFLALLILVVIGIAVVVVATVVATTRRTSTMSPPTAVSANPPSSSPPIILLPNGRRAFTETSQLYQAVDDYDVAMRGGANGAAEFSAVAAMYGYPMGTWDVSRLTDFSRVFMAVERARPWPNLQRRESVKPLRTMVIPDLSGWNVSRATTMEGMFAGAVAFTGEGLADWDVGLVVDFSLCFAFAAEFAADLSNWDTASAFNMSAMFYEAISFNGDLSSWNVAKVQSTARMFDAATSFQGTAGNGLSRWNVSQLKDMSRMFAGSIFNGNVSTWDTRNVEHMASMFDSAKAFSGDVTGWSVDKVQILDGIFAYASSFEGGDLSRWNISRVTSLSGAFAGCDVFTGNVTAWDVSQVSDFSVVFPSCPKFDGDLSLWDTSRATDMTQMFRDAHAFSKDVSSWNISKVVYMGQMFQNARSFNGNISRWNVSRVIDVSGMFAGALSFNQSLCEWRRTLPVDVVVDDIFDGTDCDSTANPTLFTTQEGTPSWFGPFCSACRI